MVDELELLSSLDPVPGISGNPGPDPERASAESSGDSVVQLVTENDSPKVPVVMRLVGIAAAVLVVGGLAALLFIGSDDSRDLDVATDEETGANEIPDHTVGRAAVSPITGLGHLDEISIPALDAEQLWLCPEGGGCITLFEARSASDRVPQTLRVPRVNWTDGVISLDCAISVCSLFSVDQSGSGEILAELSFDQTPLPDKPTLRLARSTGLLDGQLLEVSAPELAPAQQVSICAPRDACNLTITDSTAGFPAARMTPASAPSASASAWADCAVVGCSARVTTIEGTFHLPIEFDGSISSPTPPRVTAELLDSDGGATEESEFVHFGFGGLAPRSYEVKISNCDDQGTCRESASVNPTTNDSGVRHDFQNGFDECLTADRCELTVHEESRSYTLSIPHLLEQS